MQRLSKWPPAAAAAAVASFFPSKAMFDRIKPANKVVRLGPSKFNSTATVMTTPPLLKKKKSKRAKQKRQEVKRERPRVRRRRSQPNSRNLVQRPVQ